MNRNIRDIIHWRNTEEHERLKKLTPRNITMQNVDDFVNAYEQRKQSYKRYWWR